MSSGYFEMTKAQLERIELTHPILIYDMSLLQRFPNEETRLKIHIRPFTLTVGIL